jgi:hypothetical protein
MARGRMASPLAWRNYRDERCHGVRGAWRRAAGTWGAEGGGGPRNTEPHTPLIGHDYRRRR